MATIELPGSGDEFGGVSVVEAGPTVSPFASSQVCAQHPDAPSEATCDRCGRFACSWCLLPGGQCRECAMRAVARLPPLEGRAQKASVALQIHAAVIAVTMVVSLGQLALPEGAALKPLGDVISLAYALTFVGAVVFFLRWFHLATRHGLERGGVFPHATPRAAVVTWFIPLLNFVRPFQHTRALFRHAMVDTQPVATWQALWVIGDIVANGLGRLHGSEAIVGQLLANALLVGAALACWRVVQALQWQGRG